MLDQVVKIGEGLLEHKLQSLQVGLPNESNIQQETYTLLVLVSRHKLILDYRLARTLAKVDEPSCGRALTSFPYKIQPLSTFQKYTQLPLRNSWSPKPCTVTLIYQARYSSLVYYGAESITTVKSLQFRPKAVMQLNHRVLQASFVECSNRKIFTRPQTHRYLWLGFKNHYF